MAEYLTDAGVERVVLMGGTAALSSEVQTAIETLDITVDRMSGATRFETATMFAVYAAEHSNECFDGDEIGLARARIPFDSFSAAPLLSQRCAPLVLTDPRKLPPTTVEFLNDARSGRDRITLRVFGDDAAVPRRSSCAPGRSGQRQGVACRRRSVAVGLGGLHDPVSAGGP
ncbi:cell wall-binding repeat-containing protein [Candidatus Poriferisodalis sp.]|uniref:cell wall-binding repeat-containing protein n=1 Tax=Candidatus Poriferisodalis sp. TaxID=3101277 RepID=UPI003B01FF91